MLNKTTIATTIIANRQPLKQLGVEKLYLYGSYARDEQCQESDIDLLVAFDNSHNSIMDVMNVKHFLEDNFHKDIDIALENALHPRLKAYINQDKVQIL